MVERTKWHSQLLLHPKNVKALTKAAIKRPITNINIGRSLKGKYLFTATVRIIIKRKKKNKI